MRLSHNVNDNNRNNNNIELMYLLKYCYCLIFTDNYEDGIDNLPSNVLPPVPQTSRKRVRRINEWKQVKAKKNKK